ncbi:MAG: lipopolysaccharide heptosyltransferase II [Rhodoferax sp.]|nr:lipopolysaccharide heptosyltransferase II [Rhodoferax sp.]
MNSLVIAPQWIGDAVMTEPLIRRLHARGERLTVGALPWVAPVYRAMPQVDEVIELPFAHGGLQWRARRDMAAQLRGRFDAAYVCPNSLKSALLPWWANIPKRIGYHGESRWGLLSQRLPNPGKAERPPMVAFYSALSEESDLQGDVPRLAIAQERVDAVLVKLQLQKSGYVVMAPGAEYGSAKRWPARHFAALAAEMPVVAVLLGSAKEAALCAEIALGAGVGKCLNLAGKTSLDDALALIAGARAMVSNDSGLMHVAAALRVPQVALFGSSSPLHTPPMSPHARVVWLKDDPSYQPPLDCAPCFQRECPLGHTRCLVDIAPQDVLRLLPAADPA